MDCDPGCTLSSSAGRSGQPCNWIIIKSFPLLLLFTKCREKTNPHSPSFDQPCLSFWKSSNLWWRFVKRGDWHHRQKGWETKLTFLPIGSDGGHLDQRVVIKELSNIADESERHWPKGFRKCPRCYWARHRKGGRAIILWIKISAPCTGALSRIRIAVCAVQYRKVCSNELLFRVKKKVMNYASMGITPISFTIVQMSNPPLQCIFHVQCEFSLECNAM